MQHPNSAGIGSLNHDVIKMQHLSIDGAVVGSQDAYINHNHCIKGKSDYKAFLDESGSCSKLVMPSEKGE